MFSPEESQARTESTTTTVVAPGEAERFSETPAPDQVEDPMSQEEQDAINRVHRTEWVQAAASRFDALPWDMHAALDTAGLEYATADEAEKALKKHLKREIP